MSMVWSNLAVLCNCFKLTEIDLYRLYNYHKLEKKLENTNNNHWLKAKSKKVDF